MRKATWWNTALLTIGIRLLFYERIIFRNYFGTNSNPNYKEIQNYSYFYCSTRRHILRINSCSREATPSIHSNSMKNTTILTPYFKIPKLSDYCLFAVRNIYFRIQSCLLQSEYRIIGFLKKSGTCLLFDSFAVRNIYFHIRSCLLV